MKVVCVDISGMEAETCEALYARATPERRAKADRYRAEEDKIRCVVAGALLARAVQESLGVLEYTLERNGYGKPYIKNAEQFYFNLSHSGRWVVIAYGDSEVGIDVEQIREDARRQELARRYFTADEQEFIFRSEEGCPERFFQIWTGKESFLKFLGTGLTRPLDSFSVLTMQNRLHTHMLEGGYCMTLCADAPSYSVELLDARLLLT